MADNENHSKTDAEIKRIMEQIDNLRGKTLVTCENPIRLPYQGVELLEYIISGLTNRLNCLLLQEHLQDQIDSETFRKQEEEMIDSLPGKWVSEGYREVKIHCMWGVITLRMRYFWRKSNSSDVRKRSRRKGQGIYPAQMLLGLVKKCTPLLGSQATILVAAMDSMEEACAALARLGIYLDIKQLRGVAYEWAKRARALQRHGSHIDYGRNLSGRRVVVAADGGRVRIRKNKPGPRTKKGRRRYYSNWREPRLFIIYVVEADGRRSREIAPIIDSGMKDPDTIMALVCHYLINLQVQQADKLLFIGDAATWIWNRIDSIVKLVGIPGKRVSQLVDFYHAVEHLDAAATDCLKWSKKQRKQWVSRQRKHLLNGKVDKVVEALKAIVDEGGDIVRREYNFFVNHRTYMDYNTVKALGFPIGSGAVESAIRRVVNLRLKGAGIFWLRENADAMLMLRSFYKAGRWNLLKNMAISAESAALS